MNEQKAKQMTRRDFLWVAATSVLGAACGRDYEEEPNRQTVIARATATAVSGAQTVSESYYSRILQSGVQAPFRTGGEETLRYLNPALNKVPLNSDIAIYHDSSREGVRSGLAATPQYRERDLFLTTDYYVDQEMALIDKRNFSSELDNIKVLLANSRGGTRVGPYWIAEFRELKASSVFHPAQLVTEDLDRKIIKLRFSIETTSSISGASNVLRVLGNDHKIVIERSDLSPKTRDIYDLIQSD